MSNLNKIQIIGRLGKEVEMRYMQDGKAVAGLSVAVGEKWKDKQGQLQESTEWFNVSMFGRLAEIAGEYLSKGSLVYIEGKQKTEKWTDNNGQDRYTTKLIANELKMLSSKSDSNSGQSAPNSGQEDYRGHTGSNQPNPTYQKAGNAQRKPQANRGYQDPQNGQNQAPMNEPDFDFDDDIPFAPIGLQYRQLLNCM